MKKINVSVIGVGNFARPFIGCYLRHPLVGKVAVCARNAENLHAKADMMGIDADMRFTDMDEMLADPRIDAVHIITLTFDHYAHQMKALAAGKFVASAVAMGETIAQLEDIVRLRRKMGKTYMLMETSAYSRDMLKVKKMAAEGKLGRIQFIRGSHVQNAAGGPRDSRWFGYPPMQYGSHATVPLYALTGKLADTVTCFGSGNVGEELAAGYGCKDSFQVSLVTLKDSDVIGEVHRTLYATNRQFREHFDVFGSEMSYEWEQLWGEGAAIHGANNQAWREVAGDMNSSLPDSLVYKGQKTSAKDWFNMPVDSEEYILRLGHYGSYAHLVHEFVSACTEGRDSYLDAEVAANITAVGLLAVESAKQGGRTLPVPDFRSI